MMGLVTLDQLQKRFGKDVNYYCQCNGYSSFDEIQSELNQHLKLFNHISVDPVTSRFKWGRSLQKRKYLVDASEVVPYDAVVILGGDDLSEYYTYKIYRELLKYWRWSKQTKVYLLGQSIGPFSKWRNRLTMKYFYNRIPIFVRDAWSKQYLSANFGLNKKLFQGADLAFMDLPLQADKNIEKEILTRYNLQAKQYITLVISGLQGKYYTDDLQVYFGVYKKLIKEILQNATYRDKKIVLLAHTFPPHGNEAEQIDKFISYLSQSADFEQDLFERIVSIKEKILPTRARFILGNGYMTITGRMHAAVSTLQMATPAIALSYSAKYKGVIGMNLNRNDLIIESNDAELWASGKILDLIIDKMQYIVKNYDRLSKEINEKVIEQKALVNKSFDKIFELQ